MKAAAAGGLWPAASLRDSDERCDGLRPRCLAEGMETEETMKHRAWRCRCNPTSGIFSATEKWRKKAEEQQKTFACCGMRGLVPKTWTAVQRNDSTLGFQGSMSWQHDIYFSDGSGGVHSQDPRLRRAGWSMACLKQDAELMEACHGIVAGRQTLPRAQLMAFVVLAENINTAGVYEVRVDAQYLLTSIAKPARAKRGMNGVLWLRFFDACDSKPQCIIRVTRDWKSHLTAKELGIGCSTLFDMRGNTFADVAGRAAMRVQAIDGRSESA